MTYPIVNDISFWQDTADFGILRQKSVGVILRAGQGTWEDKKFQQFRQGAKAAGVPFGNYWYYDNRYSPKRQAELWASILGGDAGELGCWVDLEDSTAGAYGTYKHWYDFDEYFRQILPTAKVGIYTRAEYFNSRAPAQHVFRDYPLWIAHYKTNAPTLPRGWSDWVLWQFTAEGDGVAHGVGSKEIDCNYYKGEIVGNPPTRPQLVASFDGVEVVYETA